MVQVHLDDEAGIDWTDDENVALTLQSLDQQPRVLKIVASTYGDGDQPNHATDFADWLARQRPPSSSSWTTTTTSRSSSTDSCAAPSSNRYNDTTTTTSPTTTHKAESSISMPMSLPLFAVFGLEDSSFPHYCSFAHFVDVHLAARGGGQRLWPLHTGDQRVDQSGAF